MNNSAASKFIERALGQSREILLELIKKIFFEIHDLVLNEFIVSKKNEKLFDLKRNSILSDFSGAADLFRTSYYFNKKFPQTYNHKKKFETHPQISLVALKREIRRLDDEFSREKIKAQISNEYFNLDSIDQIANLVIDINTLRNREEHELTNFDFSQACLLFSYLNRLLTLTPDYILESSGEFYKYHEYINNEFTKLTKIFIPSENEEEPSSKNQAKVDISIEDLAQKISKQIKEENDQKDEEIKKLKEKLEQKHFYQINKKKSAYDVELNDFYKIMSFYPTKDSNIQNATNITPEWSWEPGTRQGFYIPIGAAVDDKGHVYVFHDKHDPFFLNMDEKNANEYMFSIEEIEDSWGPFNKPLKLIRELSVVFENDRYTPEEHEAMCVVNEYEFGLSDEKPTEKEKKLADRVRFRPPIIIPIEEWEYPEASLIKPDKKEPKKSIDNSENFPESHETQLDNPTVETIIRKTRKETREQLLELRNKIYTIMTNHTAFDHWDNILSSKIISNILNEKIFSIQEFKTTSTKPGYEWKTASKQQAAPFVKRDQESLELMDLQINQFWNEVQDITRNYFFDYDYIYNRKNMPWAKASLKYTEKDYIENKDLYIEILNYLKKEKPSIELDSSPFNQFSLSFIKALKRNIERSPKDSFSWAEHDDGFVIKKLRK